MEKTAVIIGAGPAGLTAAYELLRGSNVRPIVIEQEAFVGGISRTMNHNGNRIDIGGHRFFSKSPEVVSLWQTLLPLQGREAADDAILHPEKPLSPGGPDPETEDDVLLVRARVSRILYLRKFFDYPISLKPQTFTNMGLARTAHAGLSYLKAQAVKREERTLEDFIINRFGTALYGMFFRDYTYKVWGKWPAEISADWGAQRIKGLSLSRALLYMLKKPFMGKDLAQKQVETSLIDLFEYPKYGPGQLWQRMAEEIEESGGTILRSSRVIGIRTEGDRAVSVRVATDGGLLDFPADYVLSSMPICDLIEAMDADVPAPVRDTALHLPYRDFMTVGLLVNRLKLRNTSGIRTIGDRVPDCWIYVQEPDVKMGRVQIFNNWSPYMVRDFQNTVWIGLEYFCQKGDGMWNQSDEDFIAFATAEAVKIGLIEPSSVLDSTRIRVEKAYPAYFGAYENFDAVREYLSDFSNLFCIGRNGQHRYNNMDHSMLTAMEAVRAIRTGSLDKTPVWNVNTESSYHETKQSTKGAQP